jgi:hypothetical protein
MQEGNTLEEDYDFGELHRGRRYKMKKTGERREEPCSKSEEREPCAQI